MDRQIPQAPIRRDFRRVPPILVKDTITKPKNLSKEVEPQMKVTVERQEPDIGIRNGQLQPVIRENRIGVSATRPFQIADQKF
jgi:hypothetical protein